eukprot:m.157614 g.157614  ORF g.157614 m.157614 type:complete len:341 (-) comp15121_c0_seq2:190-1212(-)
MVLLVLLFSLALSNGLHESLVANSKENDLVPSGGVQPNRGRREDKTELGESTDASGKYSTAMGAFSSATAYASTAMGYKTQAKGSYSTAAGHSCVASGEHSAAIGSLSIASGYTSVAMGRETAAPGYCSVSLGLRTSADSDFSTAMGRNTTTLSNFETVVGSYNDLSPRQHNHLFTVGNGNSSEGSDSFFVTDQGDAFVARNLIVDGEDVVQNIAEVRVNITKMNGNIAHLMNEIGFINFDVKNNNYRLDESASYIQELEDKVLEHNANITNLELENKMLREENNRHSQEISSLQQEVSLLKAKNIEEMAQMQANLTSLLAMMQNIMKPCVCEDKHGCRP